MRRGGGGRGNMSGKGGAGRGPARRRSCRRRRCFPGVGGMIAKLRLPGVPGSPAVVVVVAAVIAVVVMALIVVTALMVVVVIPVLLLQLPVPSLWSWSFSRSSPLSRLSPLAPPPDDPSPG